MTSAYQQMLCLLKGKKIRNRQITKEAQTEIKFQYKNELFQVNNIDVEKLEAETDYEVLVLDSGLL